MLYDIRTLYWDNFDILRCTHQAHFEYFSKLIFFWPQKNSTVELKWPIYCAWWVQIKKKIKWPEKNYISPACSILTRRKLFPADLRTKQFLHGVQKRPQKKKSYDFFESCWVSFGKSAAIVHFPAELKCSRPFWFYRCWAPLWIQIFSKKFWRAARAREITSPRKTSIFFECCKKWPQPKNFFAEMWRMAKKIFGLTEILVKYF